MAIRTLTIPEQITTQGINHIVHYPNVCIMFYVGVMEVNDLGDWVFSIGQQFKTIRIENENYTQFISEHPSGFTEDDLWTFVV